MWRKLEKILKERGITVYHLSRISGVNDNTLRSYRNGVEPSFKNVCRIADALNISLDDLRERNDKNGASNK